MHRTDEQIYSEAGGFISLALSLSLYIPSPEVCGVPARDVVPLALFLCVTKPLESVPRSRVSCCVACFCSFTMDVNSKIRSGETFLCTDRPDFVSTDTSARALS